MVLILGKLTPMRGNVLRLMAVGLLEHSTFLTDKRLFKDTQLY